MDLHRLCQTSCPAIFVSEIGFSFIHEWFWQRGVSSFKNPPFLLYGRWVFASRCQKSTLPSQSGNSIFVWNTSEWIKTCCFFSVWILSLHSSHLSKQTHLWLYTHTRAECERWGWFELIWETFMSCDHTWLTSCLYHMLYYDQLTVFWLL